METIFRKIALEHDGSLIALAVLVCCAGNFAGTFLLGNIVQAKRGERSGWIVLAALLLGTTAWTSHFVAMLGYTVHAMIGCEPISGILSLALVIAGAAVALWTATLSRRWWSGWLAGASLGVSIGIMHYCNVLGRHWNGVSRWDGRLVAASFLWAIAWSGFGLLLVRYPRWRFASAAALAAAVLGLHFLGMAAVTLAPMTMAAGAATYTAQALALAIAATAGLVVMAGTFAHAIGEMIRRSAAEEIAAIERTDPLTGFANRMAFDQDLRKRAAIVRPGDNFAVLAIEIVNIGAINLQWGTRIGDLAIQAISRRLLDARKPGVMLARTSGSQFCGVGAVVDRADMFYRANKVQAALSGPLLIEAIELSVDVRVGCAFYPEDASDAEDLIRFAKAALSRAMADPLKRIAIYNPDADASAQRRLTLSNDLRGACSRGELELFYQPQVWIADRRVIGYEALLRWHHPTLGLVSPAEFIPLAEQSGDIIAIGEWVLVTACEEAAGWPNVARVAVNVSPLQLRQPDLPDRIERALATSGLPANRLEIELTESLLIENRATALRIFEQIKALGVRLVLDDFGIGYSSMAVLRLFPFDKVKLDKSFVDDVEASPHALAILHAMLALGRSLSIPILVEGVESERQLAILRDEGCNKVQGYLTGRPMPAMLVSSPRRGAA